MQTFLLTKDCTTIPHDVAHLYEHWFIASFYLYALEQAGYHGGTIGYIGGETYRNRLFIEAWFYNDAAAELFQSFVTDGQLDSILLERCQQQCQTEDRTHWNVTSSKLLQQQLDELRQIPWTDATLVEPQLYVIHKPETPLPFTIQKAANNYKAIAITIILPADTPLGDKAVFLRWHVIMSDIINQYIQAKGWYSRDSVGPKQDGTRLYTIQGVTLPRGQQTNASIRQELIDYLNTFDISAQMSLISAHFKEYARQPTWQGRPRTELADNGIMVGNKVISKLATKERIKSIMDALELRVENVSHKHALNIGA